MNSYTKIQYENNAEPKTLEKINMGKFVTLGSRITM